MKVFLCGGGSGEQARQARRRLGEAIDRGKPCLYIPLAMEEELYDSCYEWIRGELTDVQAAGIRMVRRAEELAGLELSDYAFLFIGGGNTFRLLKLLKDSGALGKMADYLRAGGVVFGGSAGAIIFGKDLEACRVDDENSVGLVETTGLDLLDGASILCHYTERPPEEVEKAEKYLLELSERRRSVALPEEVTLCVTERGVEVIGGCFYDFDGGRVIKRDSWPVPAQG